jgi:hypothetical protein
MIRQRPSLGVVADEELALVAAQLQRGAIDAQALTNAA